jgi:hypothetical protein
MPLAPRLAWEFSFNVLPLEQELGIPVELLLIT